VSQPEIAKKSIKPPILAFKVIEFVANREAVYNFVLVINSNLGPGLSHTVTEIQRLIGQKSQILPTPLLFSTLVRGDPLRIYGKALRFLKLVFWAADSENLVILACTAFD